MSMFFDPRRYDLAKVGRYKFNKKLALRSRIRNQILAEDVVDPSTGEILARKRHHRYSGTRRQDSERSSTVCMDSDRGEKRKSSFQLNGRSESMGRC